MPGTRRSTQNHPCKIWPYWSTLELTQATTKHSPELACEFHPRSTSLARLSRHNGSTTKKPGGPCILLHVQQRTNLANILYATNHLSMLTSWLPGSIYIMPSPSHIYGTACLNTACHVCPNQDGFPYIGLCSQDV